MDRYPINQTNPHTRYVRRAIELLKQGELVVYPTDVNYGIGCLLSSTSGVKKINELTSKLAKNKLHAIICRDFSEISEYAFVPDAIFRLMKKILPGPYTMILEAKNLVPKICQTKRKTIGVRLFDSPVTNALFEGINAPLMNFTALPYERESLIEDPDEIEKQFLYSVSMLLDIGEFPTRHTTVVDCTGSEPVVVRQGAGDYFASRSNSHVSL
jgi:tRNA threonylcarbamoyl adenosine modification protein (Sua5/YciO/YrdC/YwlC family)